MGNCCEKTQKNDKDFDLIKIFSFEETSQKKESQKEKNDTQKEIQIFKGDNANSGTFTFLDMRQESQGYPIEIVQQDSTPRFLEHILKKNLTLEDISPENLLIFSNKFLEELNLARTNPLAYSERFDFLIKNFDLFQNKIKNLTEISEEVKIIFERNLEDFKEASNFFKNSYKENEEKLNLLLLKEELKIQFPKDLKDLFNLDYYIKSYKRIKVENNFNENLKYGKLDCFMSHEDPEISFILFITDKIKEKKIKIILKNEMKYFGINYKELHDKTIVICSLIIG